ncbi:ATP-binding cassette domain-containing protein [Colwellia ponticola]|uniref:ATP-binding cassette domain-containing protein n=1 Tax=Colwellia ponticola TaxID=2304625 RepID=A0A8H2JNI2_9GAMM|nr:ATP-binding cassette domain-containing protein [Colwellia ponticola]TMM46470.1 ATP-binding cassette domain-containing protein [Colwellia ponticola]
MINITHFEHPKLTIKNWQVLNNESWCILGRNGSGKQYLEQLLTGTLLPGSVGDCKLPHVDKVGMVSFESQQDVYEHELQVNAADYAAPIGTKAKDFLPADKLNDALISEFGLSHRLESGYRQLSTGEGRKLLMLQAIFNGVELLVCDNPFDSLDEASCLALSDALARLSKTGISVLLLLNNRQDIPTWCENIAFIERGQLDVLGKLDSDETKRQLDALLTPMSDQVSWPTNLQELCDYKHEHLVKLTQGKVQYKGVSVFENLDVHIKPLQHTLITGPNGSGKSTLMQLITGDCTQCYSNDIHVLGFKRGSGESIWELKKDMGIVSAELHRQYRVNGDLLSVVLSGFYDSIGLYQQPEKQQVDIAKQWLEKIGLLDQQHSTFRSLSYGEQRLALIARALVKSPYLLILDEPTQGLDELNRHRVLNFLEHLAEQQHSTMLLVSHRKDEYLSIFKQHIKL